MIYKKFCLGMLVIALVFGMTVISCNEEEDPPPITTTTTSKPATPPSTGSVSLSVTTSQNVGNDNKYYYLISIDLNISGEGAVWSSKPTAATAKSWVTVTGLDLSSWSFQASIDGSSLILYYSIIGQSSQIAMPSDGITATIVESKFDEMKGYTNITNTLTAGTPTTLTKTAWSN